MADNPPDNVHTLFSEVLNRPFTDIQITENLAETLLQSRLRELHIFANGNLPPDIITAFSAADTLTASSAQLASDFVRFARLLSPLEKLSEKDLFGIAFLEQYNNATDDYDRNIQLEVYEIIIEEFSSPTGKSYSDKLMERFGASSYIDKITAGTAATLLVARQHSLSAAKNGMLASAHLGLVCRGLFYLVIIQKQGSRLRRTAVNKQLSQIFEELVMHLLSKIPFIGDFIGPALTAIKIIVLFAEKDFALEEMQKSLETSYGPVTEFINTYIAALSAWSEWAVNLAAAIGSMCETELPAFQKTPQST